MRAPGPARPRVAGALTLGRHPSEVERGRRFVADACRDYPGDLAGTAMLLASELVTNAVEHGDGGITVLVTLSGSTLLVEVSDESPALPAPRCASTQDEGGRGLLILDTLATTWGVTLTEGGGGKSVWFTLEV